MKQPAFAATLDHLAHVGLDDFYRGDVGREIAADLERIGSPVTRDGLAGYRAVVDEPLSVTLASGTLYNTPPPTQGLASLIILALFERLRRGERLLPAVGVRFVGDFGEPRAEASELWLEIAEGSRSARWVFDATRIGTREVARLDARLETLLRGALALPDGKLGSLSLLPTAERELLDGWNATRSPIA